MLIKIYLNLFIYFRIKDAFYFPFWVRGFIRIEFWDGHGGKIEGQQIQIAIDPLRSPLKTKEQSSK